MKVIVLAGGGGSRLFPISRSSYPKQFLKIHGEKSLLAHTVERFTQIISPSDIVVVTNRDYLFHVKNELKQWGGEGAHILLEPVGRNTAPAIALACRYCMDKLGCEQDEVILVTPSDHLIDPVSRFIESVQSAESTVRKGFLATFGIKPDRPDTGFGYILAGEAKENCCRVEKFVEKPDLATAKQYVAHGGYYWNSGMFAFTPSALQQELEKYSPEIYSYFCSGYDHMMETFAELPNISIDYAIAEKSRQFVVFPLHIYWNDVGSWDAIYDAMEKDDSGNIVRGDCTVIECRDSLFMGSNRLVAGIGLQDMIVVETNDAVLVAKKGESQRVKELVDQLKASKRKEASEHTTVLRPWGSYAVITEGPGYKVKRITVNPGQILSLQLHYHRSEHWIVISGTAKVTIADEVKMIHENQSVFVPKSTLHRLENPGRIPLQFIEVQTGLYLEEDDIVRYEDVYGRIQ
ncbi:mannose-1-phosphate guanylyltransferase/mannose-6-phosphate isomerase [Heliobacterium gestii]|uniref:mannose-1-phosphate guanylyltransferase n=1 Tax=Heliomicrobium gestii TaxID=2699 RepID=A0A845LA76_HELGE|nr:mannose-1-phosphate guanylyltransferase/mannose-6-phosphate isomerase [Heliomicrobium gestii]MBM7866602.1 mannose-1-phosphate guanylyltransferase/mannose-6-phosphate isomerase [Heliomicrobium gestii]MZP43118.1 mannose-1-phosphate guanylyltransferase/mannose-6-phosphate isomerase [Heliomicrobium gestii]